VLDSDAYNLRRATGRPLVRHTRGQANTAPTALPLGLPRRPLRPHRVAVITQPQAAGSSRPAPARYAELMGVASVLMRAMFSATAPAKNSTLARSVRTSGTASPLGSGFKVFGGSRPVASPGERTSCANCSNVASLIPGFYGRSHRAPCLTRHVPPL
jgi:hypothetical protein